ncbi:inositol polyphosphate-5-phosphatase A-like isoform X3 [Actinia tenebrosa]|uniref:inositol-polyphosphate 5-phosphatase n=1 Tax=Actinia tenebrosa TaxID=6105 RepID=A0A6P8HHP8_ACTTE|nr:inositol polyphosphate-5-phosphatase A-like isoform X3 [Actinia tenebrosa]
MEDQIVPLLLITANVGSLFEDRQNIESIWIGQLIQTITQFEPGCIALHLQECGGKLAGAEGEEEVRSFIRVLFSNNEITQRFEVRCAWIDQDYKKQEQFTALGCIYLVKKSVKNVSLWNFKESKFEELDGESVSVGDLKEVVLLEKKKFPKEFFPQCKWSRKGYARTRWKINDCVFDLLNIHLFHDASNLEAIKLSPSQYCKNRQRALAHVVDKLNNGPLPKEPAMIFGDFNFRLDTKSVVESLCAGLHSQHVRKDGENCPFKIIYRDAKSSDKIVLTLEHRKFIVQDQSHFHHDNGKRFQKYNKELEEFKRELYEYSISFPPSYPFSENIDEGARYNNSRCPSWCDRVLLSHSVKKIIAKDDGVCTYDIIGRKVCMGDHKPVFLQLNLDTSKNDNTHQPLHQIYFV